MGESDDSEELCVVDFSKSNVDGTVEGDEYGMHVEGRSLKGCEETVKELVEFLGWKSGENDN